MKRFLHRGMALALVVGMLAQESFAANSQIDVLRSVRVAGNIDQINPFSSQAFSPVATWFSRWPFFRALIAGHQHMISSGAAAVGRGIRSLPEHHERLNRPIEEATANGRWVEARAVMRDGKVSIQMEMGENVRPDEVRTDWIQEAMRIALDPESNDPYRSFKKLPTWLLSGRLRLILPEPSADPDASLYLFHENSNFFALSHGGRGPGGRGIYAHATYPLIARLMSLREEYLRSGDSRLPRIERTIRLLIRHEFEHAYRKSRGEKFWENPIEVAEILSRLVEFGVLASPPLAFAPVQNRAELENAYKSVWQAAEQSEQLGPAKNVLDQSLTLVAGPDDFSPELTPTLDYQLNDLRDENPDLYSKLYVVASEERHVSLFTLINTWFGDALDTSMITSQQRAKVQDILSRYGSLKITITGLNMGPDGACFAEGHVEDERIFELRRELAALFPDA